jgi:general nucleoside transport system permease protein
VSDTATRAPDEQAPAGRASFGQRLLEDLTTGTPVVVTLLAVVLALLIGALLIAFSDHSVLVKYGYFFQHPGDALSATWNDVWSAYKALFEGAIVNPHTVVQAVNGNASWSRVFYPLSETLVFATPLAFAGLAVTLPFRAGMFNIGAEGQLLAGAVAGGYVGFAWHLPIVIHLVAAVVAAMVGGAIWGGIAGVLKARTGAHEVITTIMLNYIALNGIVYLLGTRTFQRPGRTDAISRIVSGSARLPHLAGPALRLHLGAVLAVVAAAIVAWLLTRSTVGFELKAVGANQSAARTAGMKVERTFALVMILAGALAGLGGASQVLGTEYTLTPGISSGLGFTAITVALLGRASPGGTLLAALLFGAFDAGSGPMQAATSTPVDLVSVVQSLVVLFIAAPALVRGVFRLRAARSGVATGQAMSKGWNG